MKPGAGRKTATGELDGDWRVERTGGLLPPMAGVWKRISGDRGETRLGSLLRFPFRVERRGEGASLAYEPPLAALVDELAPGGAGLWYGRATLGGRPVGRFRMTRIGYHEDTPS